MISGSDYPWNCKKKIDILGLEHQDTQGFLRNSQGIAKDTREIHEDPLRDSQEIPKKYPRNS